MTNRERYLAILADCKKRPISAAGPDAESRKRRNRAIRSALVFALPASVTQQQAIEDFAALGMDRDELTAIVADMNWEADEDWGWYLSENAK